MLIGYLFRLISRLLQRDRVTAGAGRINVAEPTPAGDPLRMLLHQAKYDLLVSRRNPRARFFTYAMPIIFLVLFSGVFGHGHTTVAAHRVKLQIFFVPGIMAMSVMIAAYATMVVQVVTLRQTGVLKRRRATPVPAWVLIGGQALAALANTLVMSAILLVLGHIAYEVSFPGYALAAMAVSIVLGTLAFTGVSFALASLIPSADAAQPIVQITMLPLYFISGVFIPTSTLPKALVTIGKVFPVEHVADGLHRASVAKSFGGAFSATDLLILAAWVIGAAALSAWKFSWLPTTR